MLIGLASKIADATGTKKTIFRGLRGPQVEAVAVQKFGKNPAASPWSAAVTAIEKDQLSKISKVTPRIIAPDAHRRIFLQHAKADSPAQVLASAAQEASVPVAALAA